MKAYRTLAAPTAATLVTKKSEFIAIAAPVATEEAAVAQIDAVRQEHPRARHTAYAYVLRDGARTRHSDDGEPAQTAGLPILSVIEGGELTDCIITVTRYFGGVLLGTGGLVRAYGGAAKAAVDEARIVTVRQCVTLSVTLDYPDYEPVNHLLMQSDAHIEEPDFTDIVQLDAVVPVGLKERVMASITELTSGTATITVSDPHYKAL